MSESETLAFFGRVHPERAVLRTVDSYPLVHRSDWGEMELDVFIHGSQALIEATPSYDCDLATLRNQVESAVSSITDQMAFLQGQHVHVEIIGVITPEGGKRVFGVRYKPIAEKLSDEEVYEEWLPRISEVYSSPVGPYLQESLTDFRLAMEHPVDTGFYCFRAVESLRHPFASGEDDNGESWEQLRDLIGVGRETIEDDIKEYADDRRHGDVYSITADERQTAIEAAWEVIAAFLDNYEDVVDAMEDEGG